MSGINKYDAPWGYEAALAKPHRPCDECSFKRVSAARGRAICTAAVGYRNPGCIADKRSDGYSVTFVKKTGKPRVQLTGGRKVEAPSWAKFFRLYCSSPDLPSPVFSLTDLPYVNWQWEVRMRGSTNSPSLRILAVEWLPYHPASRQVHHPFNPASSNSP